MYYQDLLLVALFILGFAAADHYQTLGVSQSASSAEIKAAYRKLALIHHPDRVSQGATASQKLHSQQIFEEANAAFEVLSDPALRRQYDYNSAHFGKFFDGETGAIPKRPVVTVRVMCTLQQFGGWCEVDVSLLAWSTAFGTSVTRPIAEKLGLPLKLYLPPGSKHGDILRYAVPHLGQNGVDINVHLIAKAEGTWQRHGDALMTTVTLSAWHRVFGGVERLRGLDGKILLLRPVGKKHFERGDTVSFLNQGMPIAGLGTDVLSAERGDLHVVIDFRSPLTEVISTLAAFIGSALCTYIIGHADSLM